MRSEDLGTGPIAGDAEAVSASVNAVALRDLLADRDRLALLNEASEGIGSTLDVEGTSAELARFAVPRFAELASVEILPPESVPAGRTFGGGPLRARRTALQAVPVLRHRLDGLAPPGQWVRHRQGCPTVRCLETGHAFIGDQLSGGNGDRAAEEWACEDWACEIGGSAGEDAGAVSVLRVPLQARGQLIGVLSLLRTANSAPFDHDTAMIQAIADRAATSIDNARRFALAQDLTMELQRALLAEPGSPHANLELASRYLPCGTSAMVGGDWFETIRLSFGRTLLVIGDVMGHGVEAAVDMNSYRTLLRYVAATDLPPHRILRQLDRLTSQGDATRPATCLLALVEPARRRCTFASAGHLPPTLISPDRPADLIDVPTGPPLGTGLGDYRAVVHPLHPGQVLLLYTDGLIERRTEDIDVSLARLTRLGRPQPSTSLDQLLDNVLAAVKPTTPEDDIALLAARLKD
ncbi:GAF domain-containing protein [Streptacidiphilus sp. MAP12-16]|uniref:PP2C family protein-serine/threonine phosphatase n=1 Tax=Streptacidiphilus sp. MAP12-16 TaxID=3156300 RepID=UPI003519C8C6